MLSPVRAFLKICSKPKNFKIDKLSRVKSETAFVWPKGGIELHSVTSIHLNLSFVIFPHDSELNHAFGNRGDLKRLPVLWVPFKQGRILEGRGEFIVGLFELRLGC